MSEKDQPPMATCESSDSATKSENENQKIKST